MLIGSQLSFRRDDPARQKVRVLLWQSSHDTYGIWWLVEGVAGARRVHIKHSETRDRLRPCRVVGDRWTRTIVTIERALAERLRLRVLSAEEVAAALEQGAKGGSGTISTTTRPGIGRPSLLG